MDCEPPASEVPPQRNSFVQLTQSYIGGGADDEITAVFDRYDTRDSYGSGMALLGQTYENNGGGEVTVAVLGPLIPLMLEWEVVTYTDIGTDPPVFSTDSVLLDDSNAYTVTFPGVPTAVSGPLVYQQDFVAYRAL